MSDTVKVFFGPMLRAPMLLSELEKHEKHGLSKTLEWARENPQACAIYEAPRELAEAMERAWAVFSHAEARIVRLGMQVPIPESDAASTR